jgi:hypothetical protein
MKMNLDEVTKSWKLWGETISCSGNVKKAWRTPEFILAMYSTLYGRHDSYTGCERKHGILKGVNLPLVCWSERRKTPRTHNSKECSGFQERRTEPY